jgi:hypothetical protein
MTATMLTLLLMAGVAQLFEAVGKGVTKSRALLESNDRLRAVAAQLSSDLGMVTAPMLPPLRPEANQGYFEYTEGPIGPVVRPEAIFANAVTQAADTTVIDNDDMLMMTIHSNTDPFVGRILQKRAPNFNETPDPASPDAVGPFVLNRWATSYDAEVAWFVRGRTLYRRVLLVLPTFNADVRPGATAVMQLQNNPNKNYPAVTGASAGQGFYNDYDISVRLTTSGLVANTLGDLTKPENRYAHQPRHNGGGSSGFPFHPHFSTDWSATGTNTSTTLYTYGRPWAKLGLPTLRESAFFDTTNTNGSFSWVAGGLLPNVGTGTNGNLAMNSVGPTANWNVDLWTLPNYWQEQNFAVPAGQSLDPTGGTLSLGSSYDYAYVYYDAINYPNLNSHYGEDVVMTNVIGFDVKAWDPGAPIVADTTGNFALVPGDPGYLNCLNSGNTVLDYGAYVDLNYMCQLGGAAGGNPSYTPAAYAPASVFCGAGTWKSGIRGTEPYSNSKLANPFDTTALSSTFGLNWNHVGLRDSVYDTWSFHYENDGVQQFPSSYYTSGLLYMDGDTNGFDDNSDGVIDDPGEAETSAPYPVPLYGIRVTIRVYEPSARQVQQRTIEQDFLPK